MELIRAPNVIATSLPAIRPLREQGVSETMCMGTPVLIIVPAVSCNMNGRMVIAIMDRFQAVECIEMEMAFALNVRLTKC